MPKYTTSTLNDYDGQAGTYTIQVDPDQEPTQQQLQLGLLRGAVAFITLGLNTRNAITEYGQVNPAGAASSNPLAQRQDKWIVTYTDPNEWLDAPANTIPNPNRNRLFNVEIPTADLSLRVNNSEIVYTPDMTPVGAEIQSFVNTFQTVARSASNQTVEILRIQAVGRNV